MLKDCGLWEYMCACGCTCVHVGVHVCMWVYMCACGCTCVHVGVHVCMWVYMCACGCTCVHVGVHVCMWVCMWVLHVCMWVYTCTPTCTHVHPHAYIGARAISGGGGTCSSTAGPGSGLLVSTYMYCSSCKSAIDSCGSLLISSPLDSCFSNDKLILCQESCQTRV